MNIFGFFWRRDPTSEELRTQLFAALAQGDSHAADVLWFKHAAAIKRVFPEWFTVPNEIRRDEAAHAAYQAELAAATEFLAAKGEAQFRAMLPGQVSRQAEPLAPDFDAERAWELAVQRAQQLIDDQDYQAAHDLLANLDPRVLAAEGYGADTCRHRTWALLGVAAFRLGRKADAVRYTQDALDESRRVFDQASSERYVAQLNKINEDYRHRS
ncbi:MAG TPA: hypothetical protein PKD86_09300 [Gemmatales bacterium]|nr:hypothetical protein [Gemmatales bacterium]HMP59535.1 hypothetical protein [Gemmatales bacterium]